MSRPAHPDKTIPTETLRALRGHDLVTHEILRAIPKDRETEHEQDPLCRLKLFSPYSGWTWYVLEVDTWDLEDIVFFGYAAGPHPELGYFSFAELEAVTVIGGVPAVERDCYYEPERLSVIKSRHSS